MPGTAPALARTPCQSRKRPRAAPDRAEQDHCTACTHIALTASSVRLFARAGEQTDRGYGRHVFCTFIMVFLLITAGKSRIPGMIMGRWRAKTRRARQAARGRLPQECVMVPKVTVLPAQAKDWNSTRPPDVVAATMSPLPS